MNTHFLEFQANEKRQTMIEEAQREGSLNGNSRQKSSRSIISSIARGALAMFSGLFLQKLIHPRTALKTITEG